MKSGSNTGEMERYVAKAGRSHNSVVVTIPRAIVRVLGIKSKSIVVFDYRQGENSVTMSRLSEVLPVGNASR